MNILYQNVEQYFETISNIYIFLHQIYITTIRVIKNLKLYRFYHMICLALTTKERV